MQLYVWLFVAFIGSGYAYCNILPPKNRGIIRLQASHSDNIKIEGSLMPLHNNVLVKVKEAAATTKSGLYIPESAKKRPTEGTVVAVGPGKINPDNLILIPMTVKVGQNVLYGKFDGTEFHYNDVNHQVIKDDDILLTFTGDNATEESVDCLGDQVLVKLPPKEEKSMTGIILSNRNHEDTPPSQGTVVKIGPGKQSSTNSNKIIPMPVQPGDNVKFREYSGNQVKLGNDEYVVIRSSDIIAKW
jgi:chaperonin GroES